MFGTLGPCNPCHTVGAATVINVNLPHLSNILAVMLVNDLAIPSFSRSTIKVVLIIGIHTLCPGNEHVLR